MIFSKALVGVISLAVGVANAHMEMTYPAPFRGKGNPFTTQVDSDMTSPLSADGSNFPCKGYQSDFGTAAGAPTAEWSPGQTYNMSISGGANHNGGSCQASLSFDKAKTFTVIHSYIGNCPLQGQSSFEFVVPKDTPSGEAIFAWTWFNKVGNREMYMNCAAVKIGGGGGKKRRGTDGSFKSRPAMFVANTGNGCTTKESSDLEFPDPGPAPDVTTDSQGTAPPVGNCAGGSGGGDDGSASPSDGGSPAPSGGSAPPSDGSAPNPGMPSANPGIPSANPGIPSANPGIPSANPGVPSANPAMPSANPGMPSANPGMPSANPGIPSQPSEAQPSPLVPSSQASLPGGIFITSAAGNAPAPTGVSPPSTMVTVTNPMVTPPEETPVPTPGEAQPVPSPETPAPGGETETPTPAGAQPAGEACTNEGEWNCVGGKSFQRCASGQWSPLMAMAAGTTCEMGKSTSFAMSKARFARLFSI